MLLSVGITACQASAPDPSPATQVSRAAEAAAEPEAPQLSAPRMLRRIQLSLRGRPATVAELDRLRDAPSDEAREALLAEAIDEALTSTDFYTQSMSFAHDWFRVTAHNAHANISHGYFTGHLAIELQACPEGTRHAGVLGLLSGYADLGDPWELCDDPAATIHMVEPWWAAGTRIPVIGRAGSATPGEAIRVNGRYDCGVARVGDRANTPSDDRANPRCSCGPNLVYCIGRKGRWAANSHTFDLDTEDSSRRLASEEVARLYAHLAWYDRPLSDFVTGNYTVAPLAVKHMYVRAGRFDAANAALDDTRWWDPSTWTTPSDPMHAPGSPLAWHEVVVEQLHPNLLSLTGDTVASGDAALARTYRFDPRVESGAPRGIPAAGALTTLVGLAATPRERVRAARWVEALTCRDFIPPPPSLEFNEYRRDPATEGGCQHCHVVIDPVAIHFKRWGFTGAGVVTLGGLGRSRWAMQGADALRNEPFRRWRDAFAHSTVMTPATEAQLQQNPDARFIDFLPEGQTLFGVAGDGTIGPLGFGKILVASGELDRCAVRKLYGRYLGTELDLARDSALIDELTTTFVRGERKIRPFIRALLARPEFRRGL